MCVCHIRMTPRCVLMRELAFHAHTRYTHMPPPPSPIGWYMHGGLLFCLFSFFFLVSVLYLLLCRQHDGAMHHLFISEAAASPPSPIGWCRHGWSLSHPSHARGPAPRLPSGVQLVPSQLPRTARVLNRTRTLSATTVSHRVVHLPHHRLPSGGLWGVRFVMLQPRLPSGAASQQLLCRYYNPVTSESRTSSRCASAMHLSEARKSVASSPSCTVSHRVHLEGTLSLCPLRWQAAVTNNLLKCRDRKGRLQFVQVIAGT
jgi:hypothetical protein